MDGLRFGARRACAKGSRVAGTVSSGDHTPRATPRAYNAAAGKVAATRGAGKRDVVPGSAALYLGPRRPEGGS